MGHALKLSQRRDGSAWLSKMVQKVSSLSLPGITNKGLLPCQEKYLHSKTPPPPNFTVGVIYFGRRRSPRRCETQTLPFEQYRVNLYLSLQIIFCHSPTVHCRCSLHHVSRAARLDLVIIYLWRLHFHDNRADELSYGWLKNIPGCLFKLLTDIAHRFGGALLNFFGKYLSVCNSLFCGSASSGHILSATCLHPFGNNVGQCQFWVLQLAEYVKYGSATSVLPDDYIFLKLRELRTAWHVPCDCLRCCFCHWLFNARGRDVYQDRRNRRLQRCPIIFS